jgi:hypothetical protein
MIFRVVLNKIKKIFLIKNIQLFIHHFYRLCFPYDICKIMVTLFKKILKSKIKLQYFVTEFSSNFLKPTSSTLFNSICVITSYEIVNDNIT